MNQMMIQLKGKVSVVKRLAHNSQLVLFIHFSDHKWITFWWIHFQLIRFIPSSTKMFVWLESLLINFDTNWAKIFQFLFYSLNLAVGLTSGSGGTSDEKFRQWNNVFGKWLKSCSRKEIRVRQQIFCLIEFEALSDISEDIIKSLIVQYFQFNEH